MDRVAVITGAASGIGRATMSLLAIDGWSIVAVDADQALLEEPRNKATSIVRIGDIGDQDFVESAFEEAVGKFGRIDAVVNAAAIARLDDGRIELVDSAVFDSVVAVNLRGAFLVGRSAVPHLRETSGALVYFTSAAVMAGVGGTAYTASKAGIIGMARAVASQNADAGMRCNVVAPGTIDTPMLRVGVDSGRTPKDKPGVIAGYAQPEEVAALVRFLVEHTGRYINGATYTFDGGFAMY